MGEDANGPLVWARRDVALRTCPKPYITAESQTLLEDFFVRRRLGGMDFAKLSARQVEAFVILEKALTGKPLAGRHRASGAEAPLSPIE
ncbi:MAG: hypothetical protein WBL65_02225 [Bryobacteraceae bacterium]